MATMARRTFAAVILKGARLFVRGREPTQGQLSSAHAGLNPKYFGPLRGMTWYNLLSDQFTGLNAIPVPGTLRDSLVLLALVRASGASIRGPTTANSMSFPSTYSSCSASHHIITSSVGQISLVVLSMMCNALALSTSSAVLPGSVGPKRTRTNEKRIENA